MSENRSERTNEISAGRYVVCSDGLVVSWSVYQNNIAAYAGRDD